MLELTARRRLVMSAANHVTSGEGANRMRSIGVVVLLGAAVAGVGCERLLTRRGPTAAETIARSLAPVASSDGVVVDSVLLERPAGDPFLDRDLWASVLPVGSPETRALLAENGLRAGVLTGSVPTRFLTLLESQAETIDPQTRTFNVRKESVIPTAGPVDPCRYSVLTDLAGKPTPVELSQARCGVLIRPQPTTDARVRMYCEPRVQHGVSREWYRPSEDGTRFTRFEEVPLEMYPECGFEVTLAAADYLLIGWVADQPGTLGSALFGVEAEGRPRQRVLVVRARQMAPNHLNDLKPVAGPNARPAVAAQAAGAR